MICFGLVAFLLVCGIVVFAILTKRNANLKKNPSAENKDIISRLPDDILISIISRLPVKTAIMTSILSQRWRNHFRFVSNIRLDCSYLLGVYDFDKPHDSKLIINSVYRFLRIRSGSQIRSFHLYICLNKSVTYRFEQCIYYLGRLEVEELILRCSCCGVDRGLPFSSHLLSDMPSLKYFKLTSCHLQPSLRSQCNSLQFLNLAYVTVLPGAMECILSNCLRLQKLMISFCKCPSKLCFSGPNLRLKSLYIKVCKGVEEIEFYASNLVLFEFSNRQEVNFIFDYVPRLQTICIDMYPKNIVPYVGGKLAKDLPHLKSLNFATRGDTFQGSRHMGINMFNNLRRLDMDILCTKKINLLLLIPFLLSCPLLEEFHVNTQFLEYDGAEGKDQPVVFHSKLKIMEISGFGGTENEIVFALHILKSAMNLEKMLINRSYKVYCGYGRWSPQYETRWNEETHKMIHKQLQGQAVSRTAQLVIRYAADIQSWTWPEYEDL